MRLAAFAIATATCLVGCVDLTEPWKQKATPAGTGGSAGIEAGVGGAIGAIDAAAGGAGGAIDSGFAGAGGSIDLGGEGATGAIDLGPGGAGGVMDAPADVPIGGTGGTGGKGGTSGGLDGASKDGIGDGMDGAGTGGITGGTGGKATGGTSGGSGGKATGGTTTGTGGAGTGGIISGSGGKAGTGGTTTPDAAPDAPADLPPSPPDTSTLGTGLVVYYTCESASSTTLPDKSGNGNDGTLNGAFSFGAGKIGNALTLTSSGSGYVSMPAGVLTALGAATAMTVATWINLASTTQWQKIIDIGRSSNLRTNPMGDTTNHYMNLVLLDGFNSPAFSITTSGIAKQSSVGGTPFPTNTWTHLTVVIGGGAGTFYINGAVATGPIATNTISEKPSDLAPLGYGYIGNSWFTGDPFLNGQLDDFRIYNRALTAAEVTALYQFAGP